MDELLPPMEPTEEEFQEEERRRAEYERLLAEFDQKILSRK